MKRKLEKKILEYASGHYQNFLLSIILLFLTYKKRLFSQYAALLSYILGYFLGL